MKKTKNLKPSILSHIQQETNTLIQIGTKRKPKQEFLLKKIEDIQLLLNHLYSVAAQLALLNNSSKKKKKKNKETTTDTTYVKFLNTFLKNEYMTFKKNRYMIARTKLIQEAMNKFDHIEYQFMNLDFKGLINGKTKLEITLDDYQYFIQTYYDFKNKEFFKHKPIVLADRIEKTLNTGMKGEKYLIKVVPADTLETVLGEKKSVTLAKKDFESSVKNRESLQNKKGWYELDLLAGASVNNIPKIFEIIEDIDSIDDEIINSSDFKFGKINTSTDKFEEDFVYFYDRDIMQCCNPATYGLIDNLLIVTETRFEENYSSGYLFFRYYKGKMYLIENFKIPNGSPTLIRTFNTWEQENCTNEYYEFVKDFRRHKRGDKY